MINLEKKPPNLSCCPVIPDIPHVYANPTHVKSWQQMLPEQYAHTGQKYNLKETEKKFKCVEPLLWYMFLIIIYIYSIYMYQVNIYVWKKVFMQMWQWLLTWNSINLNNYQNLSNENLHKHPAKFEKTKQELIWSFKL